MRQNDHVKKRKIIIPKLAILIIGVAIVGIAILLQADCAIADNCYDERVCERVYDCWNEYQCWNEYSCQNTYSCWVEYSCQRWYSCSNERVCGWESREVCSGWWWWRSCRTERSYSCRNERVCGWNQWCGPERSCGWSRECGWNRNCGTRRTCGYQTQCETRRVCPPPPEISYTEVPYIEILPYDPEPGSNPQPTARIEDPEEEEEAEENPGNNNPPPVTAPQPTATPVPPTPAPIANLNVDLDADYSSLVYYASKVGEPVQSLDGSISGGDGGPYTVLLHVRNPQGQDTTYSLTTDGSFDFDSGDASDSNFGSTQKGSWSAWMEVSDRVGTSATSSSVTWQVGWYPIYETP